MLGWTRYAIALLAGAAVGACAESGPEPSAQPVTGTDGGTLVPGGPSGSLGGAIPGGSGPDAPGEAFDGGSMIAPDGASVPTGPTSQASDAGSDASTDAEPADAGSTVTGPEAGFDLDRFLSCKPSHLAALADCFVQGGCPDGGNVVEIGGSFASPKCIQCALTAYMQADALFGPDLAAIAKDCLDLSSIGDGGLTLPTLPF